ncbi:MAG: hypothetical protein ACYC8T_11625 [Myxococcaceae bacterium]
MRKRTRFGRGQVTSEYAIVTAAMFGFLVIALSPAGGWPFLVQLLNALNTYFESIYYVIQSPLP